MKHLIVTLLCAAAALAAPAQTAEFGCLTITPYVDPATGFDDATSRLLQQKLAYAVSLANASGGFDKRFVITPKADVVQQTTTATIPQKVVLRVQLTVYVGDGEYTLTTPLTISDDVTIIGTGDSVIVLRSQAKR